MKYNVGDRVRIKNFDWFRNEGANMVVVYMTKYYGEVVTIKSIHKGFYRIKEDGGQYCWIDEMFECKVEEETKPKYEDEVNGEYYSTPKYLVRPSGYQFVDENGNVINATKIVLEKKKKEYPKTYEECCEVLGVNSENFLSIRSIHRYDGEEETIKYEQDLLDKFDSLWKLRICRDAYWQIAGQEMGLNRPWEPDWNDEKQDKYGFYNEVKYTIINPAIFVFPTEEMRDAFKENFDPDIEICKKFL